MGDVIASKNIMMPKVLSDSFQTFYLIFLLGFEAPHGQRQAPSRGESSLGSRNPTRLKKLRLIRELFWN